VGNPSKAKGDDGGKRQGSPGKRSVNGSNLEAAAPKELASSESDDGSSPLAAILIAVAVLAAISIGVVVMRQRRRDEAGPDAGSPAAPKAS
jgi:hypothetical protein